MNEALKALYDRFYTKLKLSVLQESVESNHRLLIERLDKPKRKLVLRLIDDEDKIAGDLSVDSFICGFKLAWQMAIELNNYKEGHSKPTELVGPSALSASEEGKSE